MKAAFLETLATKPDLTVLFANLHEGSLINELTFQIITIFRHISFVPTTLLQRLALGSCTDLTQFLGSARLLPYALKAIADQKASLDQEQTEPVFIALHGLPLGLAIACLNVDRIAATCFYSHHMLSRLLLDCERRLLRETLAPAISTEHDAPFFVSLLHPPTQREDRSHSKQFYAVVRNCQFPAEYFTSFYIDLTQSEASHYSDIDETFIALLSLIPVTEGLVTLTLDRLFAAPTCVCLSVPFVHTVDCWAAALSYVSAPIVIHTDAVQRLHVHGPQWHIQPRFDVLCERAPAGA
jgi:hypothetical protein